MNSYAETNPPLLEQLSLAEKVVGAGAIGLVLGISSAGYCVWWLAWCAMAPFLVLVRSCKSWLEAFLVGLSFGLTYNFLIFFWLSSLHIYGVPALHGIIMADVTVLIDTLARALPLALLSLLLYTLSMRAGIFPDYRRPFFPFVLTVPVAWIFFEHLSGLTMGTCLNDLCFSQSVQPGLIQVASLGGARLLTFLLALSNTALAQLIIASGNLVKPLGPRTDRLLPITGALIDLMTIVLFIILCVLVVHGGSVSCLNNNVPKIGISISRTAAGVAINMQGHTIIESSTVAPPLFLRQNNLLDQKTQRPYLARILSLPARLLYFVCPPAGKELSDYLKSLPRDVIQVADTSLGRIGMFTGLKQPGSTLEKEEVKQGAGLLICFTDPGCFHSTIFDREMLAAAVMTAAENGRYVIFSTNRDINAIITPCGEIVARSLPTSPSKIPNALSDQIQFLYRNTYCTNVDFY